MEYSDIHHEVILGANIGSREFLELKETMADYGISSASLDSGCKISVEFADVSKTEDRQKLVLIATWMGRLGLDEWIIELRKVEKWRTNYVMPEVQELIIMPSQGSC